MLKALYEWLIDNQDTPYILVNAEEVAGVVPDSAVKDGRVVLNISPTAVEHLDIGIESVFFHCRFNGVSTALTLPMRSILSIFGRESGQGFAFDEGDYSGEDIGREPNKLESKLRLV